MKIRILAVDSPNLDGVTWWRNIRPLSELQRKWEDIEIKQVSEKATATDLLWADVVVMFRPITANSLAFIRMCKTPLFNIKVIIDIDDNLWRLPPGHPSEADYNESAQILHKIYALADGIWCSTDPLMDFCDARDGRGIVVPNAILENELPEKASDYKGVVCWRGSASQIADIQNEDAIELFDENCERYNNWLFWGYHPSTYRTKNSKGLKRVDLIEYIAGLSKVGINIMWKPLQVNEFNDAKSNIAWIEATMAGAVCVTNYAVKPGWEWAIDKFTTNPDFIESQWSASKAAIIKHYNLDKVNAIRYHHILQVLKLEGETIRA